MKNPTATIEYNAEPNFYTLDKIKHREPYFDRWKLRNDMIASVRVCACDHGFLQLGIDYKSGKQGVGYGYRSEGNIGLMIQGLASLLGVKYTNGDILKEMEGKPIRVLHKEDWGGSVASGEPSDAVRTAPAKQSDTNLPTHASGGKNRRIRHD